MPGNPNSSGRPGAADRPGRTGMSRPLRLFVIVGITCGVIFIGMLVSAIPMRSAVRSGSIPTGPVVAVYMVLVVLCVGAPLVTAILVSSHEADASSLEQTSAARAWAQARRWTQAPDYRLPTSPPAILQRGLERGSTATFAATGPIRRHPAHIQVWEQSFGRIASPITDTVVWLFLGIDGLPAEAVLAMARPTGPGPMSKSPTGRASMPPLPLVRTKASWPWGWGRVMVWPGANVAPLPAWAGVAAELEAVRGWMILSGGRMQICARVNIGRQLSVPPERIAALGARIVDLVSPLRRPAR